MNDRLSLALSPPSASRSPWQRFYGLAHHLRRRRAARKARHLPCPVISIGNLHWGGSGKTPLVAAVSAHLRDQGRQVAILSRGYRSRGKGVRVVSAGDGPLLGPRRAGDEPVLLAGLLPGVGVVVGPDRYEAGRHAMERLSPVPDVFVLDDGFSHLRLGRDLDLLAFPSADPFAGGRLPPGGRLREPLASAAHADAAILTGQEVEPPHGQQLANALRGFGFTGRGFAAPSHLAPVIPVGRGEPRPGDPVLVVSGIARPGRFLDGIRELGFQIAHELSFPDHHAYPERSLQAIRQAFRQHGARWLLTTGKDRVKLQGRLEDIPLAEVPLLCRPEAPFFTWLDERLRQL